MRNTISDIMYLNMYFTKNKTLTRFIICMFFYVYNIYIFRIEEEAAAREKDFYFDLMPWRHKAALLRLLWFGWRNVCFYSFKVFKSIRRIQCINSFYRRCNVNSLLLSETCSSLSNIKEHCFVWIKRINTLVTEKCISFRSLCPELAPCRVLMRNSF